MYDYTYYTQNTRYSTPCAGFIVFSTDGEKTILVKTHRGNLSFPKGKREKGETSIVTAFRELEEETGLSKDDIDVFPDQYIDEMSNKGNPSVRYFLCKTKDDNIKFTFSERELADVSWYDCSEVLKLNNIKNARKEVLQEAMGLIS